VELEPEDVDLEPESDPEPEAEEESVPEAESETEVEPEPTSEIEADPDSELEVEQEEEPELEHELEAEPEPENELETETATEAEPETEHKSDKKSGKKIDVKDPNNKRLILTDAILLLIVIASIVGGLVAANALVNKANAAKSEKITAVQENVKEVDLAESLRAYAADEVLEQMQVPTYTLDQLYALDLRTKTGFTEEDLKIITTRGLKGCEKAFVKAEETYGVNSIFLISIASLESAYGTQMFRPNNMFGYGRTGFSSKSECIMTVAKGLGTRYLNPGGSLYGGSPTLKGVNKRYAANPQWYYKVGKYMQRYYNELAAAKNGNLEKFE
jgi:beta-N-acetylglucosaminidase